MKVLNKFLKWFDGKGRKYSVYAIGMLSGTIAFCTSTKFTGDNLVTLIIALSGIFTTGNAVTHIANRGQQ